MRVLILGGTGDANRLVSMLAHDAACHIVLSLAGRTSQPHLPPCATRVGGFGGSPGMAAYLKCNSIDLVADVTHPFAANISQNAVSACAQTGVALVRFERTEFTRQKGDDWHIFTDLEALVQTLAGKPRRIFLSHGREGLRLFARHKQHHYLVRSIEPPPDFELLADARLILARGPFALDDEIMLLREAAINTLVSKNSGGDATAAKIAAARQLGLEVMMLARPRKAAVRSFTALNIMAAWILAHGQPP